MKNDCSKKLIELGCIVSRREYVLQEKLNEIKEQMDEIDKKQQKIVKDYVERFGEKEAIFGNTDPSLYNDPEYKKNYKEFVSLAYKINTELFLHELGTTVLINTCVENDKC